MLTRGSWHRFRALAAALSVLALVACGFHLQGKVELPRSLANARIEATDQQSDFYSSLRSSLTTAGANLDGPEANAAVIRILEDSSSERVLRMWLITPPKKAMSVPVRSGMWTSATALVRVYRGSTWKICAPRSLASTTH